MVKVSLIGKGKWGAAIENAINDLKVEWVESKDADWIIISTPNDLHYEQVKYWLTRKKNVFCEKPLTLSIWASEELFSLARSMGVKLYVDDVFMWREDLPTNPTEFHWNKEDNTNYIDRLAYHHFYLWLQDFPYIVDTQHSHIEVLNDDVFKITIENKVGVFDYKQDKNVTHRINNIEVSKCEDNPLRTMFAFIFGGDVDFHRNEIRTLNATRLSYRVKKRLYPNALVVGGGIFGVTSAVALRNSGYNVTLHEEKLHIMQCASNINQYRLHKGYHYPRSIKTAIECEKGLKTFKRKYGDSVVNGNIQHYYGIASEDSKVSDGQYIDFLNDLDLPYKKGSLQQIKNVDLTVKVDEELFSGERLGILAKDKLYGSSVIVKCNTRTIEEDLEHFDVVVIATYSKLNELLDEPMEYQYEVVEKPVVKLPEEYKNKSIVIMDGPFMCLDPINENQHVLGNVVHAIHETNVGYEPIVSDDLKYYLNRGIVYDPEITNIDKFIESGKKYFKDFDKLEHIGSMYTIRTVLKDRDHDDARPTLVRQEGHNIFTIFSGKIDTCVDAANELVKRVSVGR